MALLLVDFLQVPFVSLDFVVDEDSGKCALEVAFKLLIRLAPLKGQGVSCDDQEVDMLHLGHEPETFLLGDQVVSEVKLL